MKRSRYIILASILVCTFGALLYYHFLDTESRPVGSSFSDVPERMVAIGPFAKDISITENVGTHTLSINAKMVHVKKSKFLGFSTSLKKNIVSKDIDICVYKDGRKKLELFKDRLVMNSNMNFIEIRNPKMLFPENSRQKPRSVIIDKDHKLLTIQYKDRTDTWNLSE